MPLPLMAQATSLFSSDQVIFQENGRAPMSVAVRPTFAQVDLGALRANYHAVSSYVRTGDMKPVVIAVVNQLQIALMVIIIIITIQK